MKGMYLGRRFYRQMFGLVLVMILAPEGLAAQDAIATALDRIHREYSSGPMDTARLVLLDRELREISCRPLRGRFDEGPSKGPAVS